MKSLRFQPGAFLEIDDLAGGRKAVMVGKDGVTFWDVLDAKQATPFVIHPSLRPVALGSFVQFSAAKGLQSVARQLIAYLRRQQDPRLETNPLFTLRALWFIAQRSTGAGDEPDEAVLQWACQQAQAQEDAALRIQRYAEQYCALTRAPKS